MSKGWKTLYCPILMLNMFHHGTQKSAQIVSLEFSWCPHLIVWYTVMEVHHF